MHMIISQMYHTTMGGNVYDSTTSAPFIMRPGPHQVHGRREERPGEFGEGTTLASPSGVSTGATAHSPPH
jgi:hypothetical protein